MTVKNDFENGPFSDWSRTVTRIPVIVVTSLSGQKTYVDGTPEEINVVVTGVSPKFNLDKPGLTETFDLKILTKENQEINKYDKIIHKERTYRVDTVNKRKFMGTLGFKSVGLFFTE